MAVDEDSQILFSALGSVDNQNAASVVLEYHARVIGKILFSFSPCVW